MSRRLLVSAMLTLLSSVLLVNVSVAQMPGNAEPPDECYEPPFGLVQIALCPAQFKEAEIFMWGQVSTSEDDSCAAIHTESNKGLSLDYTITSGQYGGFGIHWPSSESKVFDASPYTIRICWCGCVVIPGKNAFRSHLREQR